MKWSGLVAPADRSGPFRVGDDSDWPASIGSGRQDGGAAVVSARRTREVGVVGGLRAMTCFMSTAACDPSA